MSGWGKAGVRLTDREREQLRRKRAAERNRAEAARARDHAEAYSKWKRGMLVPEKLTIALDARGLQGPQVDIDCGAVEPAVDQWEAGELYPTWEQLQLLAKLTGYPLRFFFTVAQEISGGIMCTPSGCRPITPSTAPDRYPREVVLACAGTEPPR